ncbi:MAG: ABC transporter ATP-binding protein [Deltaproteobacteria bacterium]|nr:ABC transporter ATP-binding protein [Deltaproteobacteria bacterium]MCL5276428.1 ABC transporter ATP-binding protein [Deltaproteobacteria bacterium]
MIELKGITKKYGDRTVLNSISFRVEKGEVLGFLGPNGAGKTTTMRIITGYLSPTMGEVMVEGYDIKKEPVRVRSIIGYLPELAPAYPEMTVLGYLKFMAGIKGLSGRYSKDAIDRVIQRISLDKVKDRIIGNLSRGYRQRVGIAQALLSNPSILILDEPTVGLDPEQIIEIRNLIRELGSDHTIILSTHVLPEVTVTCNRVLVINDGKLLAGGDYNMLSDDIYRERTYRLVTTRLDDGVVRLIESIDGIKAVERHDDGFTITIDTGFKNPEVITDAVFKAGYSVAEFSSKRVSLEDVYIKLLSHDRGGIQ